MYKVGETIFITKDCMARLFVNSSIATVIAVDENDPRCPYQIQTVYNGTRWISPSSIDTSVFDERVRACLAKFYAQNLTLGGTC